MRYRIYDLSHADAQRDPSVNSGFRVIESLHSSGGLSEVGCCGVGFGLVLSLSLPPAEYRVGRISLSNDNGDYNALNHALLPV